MGTTVTAEFENRRDAEMSVERLVQEQGIERMSIFIAASGDDNTVGQAAAGADVGSGYPGTEADSKPALGGPASVSVDLDDDAAATKVRDAFGEFGAANLSEK